MREEELVEAAICDESSKTLDEHVESKCRLSQENQVLNDYNYVLWSLLAFQFRVAVLRLKVMMSSVHYVISHTTTHKP